MREVYFKRRWNWVFYFMLLLIIVVMFRAGDLTPWPALIFVAIFVFSIYEEYRTRKLGFDESRVYLTAWGAREVVPFENIVQIRLRRPGFRQRTLYDGYKLTYLDETGAEKSCLFHVHSSETAAWGRLMRMIMKANPAVVVDIEGPWFN